ncbi:XRE family transcriptional regulator [Virgisporangium ochraceum]|uniref:XRE family transcriptional regulator n=1 Tax=Virgisporangium ochraceum TaxID=65505 RepID=A0A8J4EGF8_9ACTN|nr:XRE family transcriptional regulator [Virgisporangium ochraceum]
MRILGPLEVRVGDRVLDLGGPRRQRLLAMLAARAGQPVGYEQLAEAIWDVDAPPTARRQAQNAVSQVRSLLHRAQTGIVVATVPAGYRLDVDPWQLDASRFRLLVAAAERRGSAEAAIDDLGAALDLWRGPALAGLDSGVLRREAVALEEARLAAAERWAGLALPAGRHDGVVAAGRPDGAGRLDAVVATLTDLALQHPLRERVALLLMAALHRAGRWVDAVDAYRRFASDLDREVGVAPGPDIRRLRDTILRDGVRATATPAGPPAPAGVPVPAQVPAPPSVFEGRADDLSRLDAAGLPTVDGPPRVVVVEGPAGVGKSALAARWAHDVRAAFPDGQLFIDLRGFSPGPGPSTREVLAGFAQALGVPTARVPTASAALQGLYRSLLADRRVLVVLDNAATVDQVMPLLPGASASTVLVTSRRRLPLVALGVDAHPVVLSGLDRPAAVALLRSLVGAGTAIDAAADLCAGLPLALRICAANAAAGDPDAVLAGLRGSRLDALALTEHQLAVRSALHPSYRALPPAAARLFRLLGTAPGTDLSSEAAAALLDADPATTRAAVTALADSYLLDRRPAHDRRAGGDRRAGERLQMHDLVRLYAAERCAAEDPPDEVSAAMGRLRAFYRASVFTAAQVAWPSAQPAPPAGGRGLTFASSADALAWLDRERATIVATVRHAATRDDPAAVDWAADTAATLMPYLWAHRHTSDWLDIGEAAAAGAERVGGLPTLARMTNFVGVAHWSVNGYEAAIDHMTRAFDLNTRLGRTRGAAANISNLAAIYRATGRLDAALDNGLRAAALYESIDDPLGWANTLLTVGMVHRDAGRLTEALDLDRRLLDSYRAQGHGDGEASALLELNRVLASLGRRPEALAAADAVLHLPPDVLSRINRSSALAAVVRSARPPLDTHLRLLSALLDDAPEVGDGHVECEVAVAAGVVAARLGRHREAVGYFGRARDRAVEIGDVSWQVEAVRGAAESGHRLGPHPDHLRRLGEALALARRHGLRICAAECLATRAVLASDLGDAATARSAARAALDLRDDTGMAFTDRALDGLLERLAAR